MIDAKVLASSCEQAAGWISEHLLFDAKKRMEQNRFTIIRELAEEKEMSAEFQYRVQKMLYHISRHPRLKDKYTKCCEYLYRYCTEKQPEGMKYEEWQKKRLTEAKVLSYLKRTLAKQSAKPPQDRIALVKRDYDFVYKGYSAKARQTLTDKMKQPIPLYIAASSDGTDAFPKKSG